MKEASAIVTLPSVPSLIQLYVHTNVYQAYQTKQIETTSKKANAKSHCLNK